MNITNIVAITPEHRGELAPPLPTDLGPAWVVVLVSGVLLFAYLDIISTQTEKGPPWTTLCAGLWGLLIALLLAIGAIIVHESLRILHVI